MNDLNEAYGAIVQKHLDEMMEYFDSIQIIAVRYDCESEETHRLSKGKGNWYSRYGSVRDWVDSCQADTESEVLVNKQRNADE